MEELPEAERKGYFFRGWYQKNIKIRAYKFDSTGVKVYGKYSTVKNKIVK